MDDLIAYLFNDTGSLQKYIIVLVLEDFEQFSPAVIEDFLSIVSHYKVCWPVTLLLAFRFHSHL